MRFPGASKYHARAVVDAEGRRFDSRAEYRRYQDLKLLEHAGAIADLEIHPVYELYAPVLMGNGAYQTVKKVGRYTADFRYRVGEVLLVEDVKGGKATRTEAYRLRKRIVEATYGIQIAEVTIR